MNTLSTSLSISCLAAGLMLSSAAGHSADADCENAVCPCSGQATCDHPDHSLKHDRRGPAGVMGDHLHPRHSDRPAMMPSMVSYRYMDMAMRGLRSGTSDLSTEQVLEDFSMAPGKMDMRMHMFGLMFAPADQLNLMVMAHYNEIEMEHVDRHGHQGKMRSSGFGDTSVSGIFELAEFDNHRFLFNAGVSIPTGSISERGVAHGHMHHDPVLPYAMQLGSGTWDLLPGITYLGHFGQWSWGAQAGGVIRTGRNSSDYRLGDRARLTAWGSYRWTPVVSTSVRLDGQKWGRISGQDPEIMTEMMGTPTSPSANPSNSGGERVDFFLGVNLIGQGRLEGHRLAIEAGMPIYEDLNGTQMSMDRIVTVGWSYSF